MRFIGSRVHWGDWRPAIASRTGETRYLLHHIDHDGGDPRLFRLPLGCSYQAVTSPSGDYLRKICNPFSGMALGGSNESENFQRLWKAWSYDPEVRRRGAGGAGGAALVRPREAGRLFYGAWRRGGVDSDAAFKPNKPWVKIYLVSPGIARAAFALSLPNPYRDEPNRRPMHHQSETSARNQGDLAGGGR